MQELNEKLNKINDIRKEIKNTINEKGGTLADTTPFEEYPAAIENLKSGGGDTMFAYYNGTDIEAGKKVLLTRTNNAMATDDTFMNGKTVSFIHDGIAYCRSTSTNIVSEMFNIIDGKIDESLGKMTTSTVNNSKGTAYIDYDDLSYKKYTSYQSCCKNGILLSAGRARPYPASPNASYHATTKCNFYKGIYYGYVSGSTDTATNIRYATGLYFLENFVVWQNCYSSKSGASNYNGAFIVDLNNEHIFDTDTNTIDVNETLCRLLKATRYRSSVVGWAFEREEDAGKCVYFFNNDDSDDSTGSPVFLKYNYETGVLLSSKNAEIEVPHYYSTISGLKAGAGEIYHQTKDYKYLLHPDYYILLDGKSDVLGEPTNIIVKEYPDVIKNAMGERTIISIQAFYDNTFAFSLSDGATLMCRYDGTIPPQALMDNDLLAHCCKVEEIAPYVAPDDESIYHRQFSGDKMYWFLVQNRTDATSKAMASPFEADQSISSYLAVKNTVGRYNSTVLTGFMTGNTADDNGLHLVEVKTVTG